VVPFGVAFSADFPYALLYKIKPSGIQILAVMSLKRRPSYWVGRE
jgi:hypothetical protein